MEATTETKKTRRTTINRIADIAAKRIASLEARIEKARARHVAPLEAEILELRTAQTHVGVPSDAE